MADHDTDFFEDPPLIPVSPNTRIELFSDAQTEVLKLRKADVTTDRLARVFKVSAPILLNQQPWGGGVWAMLL